MAENRTGRTGGASSTESCRDVSSAECGLTSKAVQHAVASRAAHVASPRVLTVVGLTGHAPAALAAAVLDASDAVSHSTPPWPSGVCRAGTSSLLTS